MSGFRIAPATAMDEVATLFCEYAGDLGIDLGRQGFEAELAGLPGAYAPPQGAILVARDDGGMALGCVALRPLEGACEMKRMFVRHAARGRGVGRALLVAILDQARVIGYREMKLDTLARLTAARELYREYGFREIAPYAPPLFDDQLFYGLQL